MTTDLIFVVDATFPQLVCDKAHRTDGLGHHMPSGFCAPCAIIYRAVMDALPEPYEVAS